MSPRLLAAIPAFGHQGSPAARHLVEFFIFLGKNFFGKKKLFFVVTVTSLTVTMLLAPHGLPIRSINPWFDVTASAAEGPMAPRPPPIFQGPSTSFPSINASLPHRVDPSFARPPPQPDIPYLNISPADVKAWLVSDLPVAPPAPPWTNASPTCLLVPPVDDMACKEPKAHCRPPLLEIDPAPGPPWPYIHHGYFSEVSANDMETHLEDLEDGKLESERMPPPLLDIDPSYDVAVDLENDDPRAEVSTPLLEFEDIREFLIALVKAVGISASVLFVVSTFYNKNKIKKIQISFSFSFSFSFPLCRTATPRDAATLETTVVKSVLPTYHSMLPTTPSDTLAIVDRTICHSAGPHLCPCEHFFFYDGVFFPRDKVGGKQKCCHPTRGGKGPPCRRDVPCPFHLRAEMLSPITSPPSDNGKPLASHNPPPPDYAEGESDLLPEHQPLVPATPPEMVNSPTPTYVLRNSPPEPGSVPLQGKFTTLSRSDHQNSGPKVLHSPK